MKKEQDSSQGHPSVQTDLPSVKMEEIFLDLDVVSDEVETKRACCLVDWTLWWLEYRVEMRRARGH